MASAPPATIPATIAQSCEPRSGTEEWNASASNNMNIVPLICVIVVNRNAFARRDANPPRKSLRPQAHVAARLRVAGAIWVLAGT